MNINDKREVRRLCKLMKKVIQNENREQYTYAIAKSKYLCGDTNSIILDDSCYDRAMERLNNTKSRTGVK